MFEGQPKGLWALALANTGERFGYYTMLAVFLLYLQANFGFAPGLASGIYSTFLMLVYFLPVIGGIAADRFGFGKMVTTGIFIMFIGYLLLSIPMGGDYMAIIAMGLALILVSLGTGLFKGNLQVMVGRLYDAPQYADKRDSGFSLFYMAINIGAMFAPTAAIKIMEWAQVSLGASEADSYHYAFAVACVSLIVSIAIYYLTSGTYKHVLATEDKAAKGEGKTAAAAPELSKEETKERIVCLCLVRRSDFLLDGIPPKRQHPHALCPRLHRDAILRAAKHGLRRDQPRGLHLHRLRIVRPVPKQERTGQRHQRRPHRGSRCLPRLAIHQHHARGHRSKSTYLPAI